MKSTSSDLSRLDKLENKENKLEEELKRLEKEEQALRKKLGKIEARELEIARKVSELEQVKRRRPDFLDEYIASMDNEPTPQETRIPKPESKKEEDEIKSGRKKLLKTHVKKMFKRQEIRKEEEQRKQEILDSKVPIKELKMDNKKSDSMRLFETLLSEGVMTVDAAAKLLEVDKRTVEEWANDLENTGIIEVSKPIYGSPKLKLKSLSARTKNS